MNTHNTLAVSIESLLFFLNEEVSKKRLADMVSCSMGELEMAVAQIRESRKDSGIVLVETSTTVVLGTHPDSESLIAQVTRVEQSTPLSKAALETLSVVLYRAPVGRAEIDMVRGVNSLYSVRTLLVRGLVSRRTVEGKVVYEPTVETLQLLGIRNQGELPDYAQVLDKVDQLVKGQGATQSEENSAGGAE